MSSVTSECGNWGSLARERNDDIISLRALFETCEGAFQLLEDQLTVAGRMANAPALNREACGANVDRLQALLSRYRDSCNRVTERLSNKGIRQEAARVAAANRAKDAVGCLLSSLFHSMKD